MANERVGGRWILDTAELVVAAGTFIRIKTICFVGTTKADICILHDGNGKEIWKAKLGDLDYVSASEWANFGAEGIVVDGLDLDTITHGTIYVYLGKLG